MGSFLQSKRNEVYDPIRRQWVTATPEEKVRQALVQYLVKKCHFPLSVISIEKKLSELPFVKQPKKELPDRRLDLLCFGPKLSYPLLLIECKGVPLQEKMVSQVLGYNAFVQARFVALVNASEIKFIWEENEEVHERASIPSYQELVKTC